MSDEERAVLRHIIESPDEVPAGLESYYQERDGRFFLQTDEAEALLRARDEEKEQRKKAVGSLREATSAQRSAAKRIAELEQEREHLLEQLDSGTAGVSAQQKAAHTRELSKLKTELENYRVEASKAGEELDRLRTDDAMRRALGNLPRAPVTQSALDMLLREARAAALRDDESGRIARNENGKGWEPFFTDDGETLSAEELAKRFLEKYDFAFPGPKSGVGASGSTTGGTKAVKQAKKKSDFANDREIEAWVESQGNDWSKYTDLPP